MRREFTSKVKATAARRSNGFCECCTRKMMAGDWHYDHVVPDALGGEPTLENCQVLCRSCHSTKTSKEDIPRIAKSERNFRRNSGIKKAKGWTILGSKASGWRHKINGNWERRQRHSHE